MNTPIERRVEEAIRVASKYGQIDGSHHKMWTIDKMVKILCGGEKGYKNFIEEFEEDGEYHWDTGVAP